MLAAQVKCPVRLEVPVVDDGAEPEDGLGSLDAPPGAGSTDCARPGRHGGTVTTFSANGTSSHNRPETGRSSTLTQGAPSPKTSVMRQTVGAGYDNSAMPSVAGWAGLTHPQEQ